MYSRIATGIENYVFDESFVGYNAFGNTETKRHRLVTKQIEKNLLNS